MLTKTFRTRFFYLLISCKILTILWLLFLWVSNSYSATQTREILLIIVPLFAANITLALNYFLKENRKNKTSTQEQEQKVSGPIRITAFAGTSLYGICIIFFLTYYATLSGDAASFLSLKEWIGITEIIFGGYIGLIVADIFNISKQNEE